MYIDDFGFESEEDMRAMVGSFVEMFRRGLKVNIDGEEGLECEVCVDGIRLKHFSEFKYLGSVLDESGTDEIECSRKVESGKRVAGAIRSLVNVRCLQLECARVLHEKLLVPVLTYDSEKMIWKEKDRSRIRAVQMDNLRGLLVIRRGYRKIEELEIPDSKN